ncbi:MAG: hypothetical protein K2G61_02210 [Bacteroidaceae bacterium]|nr:hypothetical protein [Bacteroidaceae bacterium]
MKNRFSKVSRGRAWILILLAVSGVTSSCKDEYLLDDQKPTWLDVSIYEKLQRSGQNNYYLRLLADPDVNNAEDADNNRGWVDVLSKTGSKTLFVADDDAWEKFFESNALLPKSDPWSSATSYENLSEAQKKLLIHTSMLNNAMVMENLSSSGTSSASRGMLLRRYTDVETTDTITYVSGDDLPVNYNINNGEKDYWSRFRTENGGKGIYLVTDSTPSMIIHFTNEYLTRNRVTPEDFQIFANQERVTSDVHIYDHRLLKQDAVCENGYVNTTSGVLKPLASMAEVLRTNGRTRIFSHMIDRWSVPFYSPTITRAYEGIMASKGIEWKDSIFVKRYFSERSFGGKALNSDPDGLPFQDNTATQTTLKFDPAWNGYYEEKSDPQYNMSSMYVPVDDALWDYFSPNGGGWQLIQTFCDPTVTYSPAHTEEDYEKLFRNIDQIPRATLRSLINVIMFAKFTDAVPSKMTKLRDDANEQIFYDDDRKHIIGTLLASNGAIYLTDRVYGPADYTSVTAPAYISNDKLVMRWAIYYGSVDGENQYLNLNYYAYLKAMKSRFALFLPTDDAMQYLYDPVSFKSLQPRVMELAKITVTNNSFPIRSTVKYYAPETGDIKQRIPSYNASWQEVSNRLKDILETHTFVLESREEIDTDVDEYYLSKNGSPMRVTREDGRIVKVQGGFQLENEANGLENVNNGVTENKVTDFHRQQNGRTYILDSPMVATPRSVYSMLTNDGKMDDPDFQSFYELCIPDNNILHKCGLVNDNEDPNIQVKTERKYEIFSSLSQEGTYAVDENVTFFSNYRYTIFVPTAAALEKAIKDAKLPSWEDIKNDYKECEKEEDGETLVHGADSLRLQTKITCLTNFIRYHFLDNSVFVDQSKIAESERVSSSYDRDKGLFNKVKIQRDNGKLEIKDVNGGDWLTVGGRYNLMTRDVYCNKAVAQQSMQSVQIESSSFAVIHQIPGVLNHVDLKGGTYESLWQTESNCRRYLKRYAIK